LQDRESIDPRHVQIQHYDIGAFSTKDFQALPTTRSEYHLIALPPKERVEELPDALLIINHENHGHGTSQD
jgi:hypothetical protein